MAGQGPSRRELLQALTLAATAAACPGFARWSYGLSEHTHQDPSGPMVHPVYTPQYFSPAQYKTIEVVSELILPATHDDDEKRRPGAKDAGVAEFIDFMAFSDPSLQPKFAEGVAWLDRAARPSASFTALPPPGQNAILERLAYKAKHKETEKAGQQFFQFMRQYTVMGFYTTRIGLESLDYPGLKFYSSSPGCTHAGNPEHVGL